MPYKDPLSYTWLTYFWVGALAAWGGISNYIYKVKVGMTSRYSLTELIGELVTCTLAGVITFWLCELAALPPLLSAVFIAVSGHMGARLIFILERKVEQMVTRWMSGQVDKSDKHDS